MKKIIFTLLALSLIGCAQSNLPAWPEKVKKMYAVDVDPKTKEVQCAEFEIQSTVPFKYKYVKFVDIMSCQALIGFAPDEMVQVDNWISDVQIWAKDRTCKLK